MEYKPLVVIGYSGHAYVVLDAAQRAGFRLLAYLDKEEKKVNPFNLAYWGSEENATTNEVWTSCSWFVAIGANSIRRKVQSALEESLGLPPVTIAHPSAIVSPYAQTGNGILLAANTVVQPMTAIGDGAICNTNSTIEHECSIGRFAHIAPGAVLCGNVTVGENSFIGANAVVKPGIHIGQNVVIGAGSVVLNHVPDGSIYAGNPARPIRK